jgi:hypothetical protein
VENSLVSLKKKLNLVTWLDEPDVEDFVDLRVVGSNVENTLRRVLDAGDVDRYQVF